MFPGYSPYQAGISSYLIYSEFIAESVIPDWIRDPRGDPRPFGLSLSKPSLLVLRLQAGSCPANRHQQTQEA